MTNSETFNAVLKALQQAGPLIAASLEELPAYAGNILPRYTRVVNSDKLLMQFL